MHEWIVSSQAWGQPILDFYSGLGCDNRGRYLRDIQGWSDQQLEAVHDFIQWMFPLTEPSGVNAAAPVLNAGTIAAFENTDELRASFLRMLRFYGLAYGEGKVTRARNFVERARNWLSPGNHNHLRITRILKSLRLLGLEEESQAFYECLVEIYQESPGAITERTLRFWSETQARLVPSCYWRIRDWTLDCLRGRMSKNPSPQNPALMDPKDAGPKPPYAQNKIAPPGLMRDMTVKPDHGEETYKGSGRLKDRVALITGGDSGIGRAVALAFAREGADVAIAHLREEEDDAAETAKWVKEAGRKSLCLAGDICDEQHCKNLVSRVVKEFGTLDLLVNNAAFQMSRESIEEISTEEFDRTFKTNLYAMFWLCRAAMPIMKPGSSIVNTASIQALDPSPNLLPYAATKAAIVNFTKGLSQIAMKRGVRVNAVAPGPVWTPLIPSTMPEKKVKNFGGDTSFERAAQPVEIAPVFVFLASNEARFVTGEVYGVTGGQTPY